MRSLPHVSGGGGEVVADVEAITLKCEVGKLKMPQSLKLHSFATADT